jgi:hypothetical protein
MSCALPSPDPLQLEDRAGLGDAERARLQAVVSGQRTLEDVVRWGLEQAPPLVVADVVVQDEYTHDVVLPSGNGAFLVYDTT